ncbi:DNA-binding transcriptional regulator, GntR family [Paracoccus aminovorans]|uniref:DNA-binding transcriptional regulator, GntR family n=2 Tax=Paracoccus aminovorans TaxID=34004 RepID=A0A1I3DV32_9RHOB|nr:GntR family transcriptional regulator [Paracoccus aminovorans]SFH90341.1 DNA-binding transcriptional regulator, GntR family [Paracoccus aminovorans]
MTGESQDQKLVEGRRSPFEHLLNLIEKGELRPGRRLLETELAERLGISRTPVREALHRLRAMGLAEPGPQRGLIIAHMSYDQLRQLFAVREGLEGMATRLAASHASLAEIALLREMVAEDRRTTDRERLVQRNKLLHRQIVQASHNAYMVEALNNLSVHIGLLPSSTYATPGRIEAAQAEHEEIVAAIAERDGERAERAARKHIAGGFAIRLRMLAEAR